VYGDFTDGLAHRLEHDASLDVVDVLPIQLANLERKLAAPEKVSLYLRNAAALGFADACYDRAIAFFLLHEQPVEVRRHTLAELVRVVKPGGRIVIVDYHRPRAWNPLRYFMPAVLSRLEPYALDLWREPIANWLPPMPPGARMSAQHYFGGLYQLLVIQK
jgi:ubiquinone/menaquinone biosynthesis C-methylase UbiE